jgi:transcriptional regulator with GAF, ATPase, and Fis domain
MAEKGRTRTGEGNSTGELREAQLLERRSWRNWFFFVGVAILTTGGLAVAILSLRGGRVEQVWPWSSTEQLLLAGLTVAILLFAMYLTLQERQVVMLRRELIRTNRESALVLRRTYDRLVALLGVSRVLATETNPQKVFDSITSTCHAIFECQQASLLLLNASTGELEVRSVAGHDPAAEELATRQKVGQGLVGWVARERKPLVLGTGSAPPGSSESEPMPPISAMVAPILMREELVGVLSVSSSAHLATFGEDDLQAMLLFAESVGICCRHAEQTSWMRQTIQRLDAALQGRDTSEERRAA